MAKTLDQVDREIKDAERRRLESGAQLMQKIASLDTAGQNLREETRRLTDALKRPGVRGRWGELQLKRVVELAGMVEHCDFNEQQTIQGDDDGRIRPDVIVQLPGGKRIVIDAKAPLDAYLHALEAPDEAARQQLLGDHARQVRSHMAQLSAKGYGEDVPSTPDFVVMFLPGEMFFSAALEQDPSLIECGVEKRVYSGEPHDAHRAVAGSRLRVAAGGDGGKRPEDQRARPQSVRVRPHARRRLRDAGHDASSRASTPTTMRSVRSKATCSSRLASSRSCRRPTAVTRSRRSSRSTGCRACCRHRS